ncbi:MAG TPA: hypothetical protein DCY40_01120 [Actinobacteria bacterium]|nr:hypothetical protein [Actinomycetota bacterium]
MTSRQLVTALLFGVLVSACSQGHYDGTTIPQRPPPAEAARGPEVRTRVIGQTSFALHDEGDGCLAVVVSHPGLQSTVGRRCLYPGELTATNICGWLADPPPTTTYGACDVTLPQVFFGQAQDPNIGYVCVGTILPVGGAEGVMSARFLDMDGGGYILDAPNPDESTAAHLFTPGGIRYGFEPLDAPSDPIYRFCEDQHPWGATEYSASLRVFFDLGAALRSDEVVILIDTGTGPRGMSGLAGGEEGIHLPTTLPASSPGLAVRIEVEGAEPVEYFLPWPEAVRTLLDAGRPCRGGLQVRLTLEDSALSGSAAAAALTLSANLCG